MIGGSGGGGGGPPVIGGSGGGGGGPPVTGGMAEDPEEEVDGAESDSLVGGGSGVRGSEI